MEQKNPELRVAISGPSSCALPVQQSLPSCDTEAHSPCHFWWRNPAHSDEDPRPSSTVLAFRAHGSSHVMMILLNTRDMMVLLNVHPTPRAIQWSRHGRYIASSQGCHSKSAPRTRTLRPGVGTRGAPCRDFGIRTITWLLRGVHS